MQFDPASQDLIRQLTAWQAQAAQSDPGLYGWKKNNVNHENLWQFQDALSQRGLWDPAWSNWVADQGRYEALRYQTGDNTASPTQEMIDAEANHIATTPNLSGLEGYRTGDARSEGHYRMNAVFGPDGQMIGSPGADYAPGNSMRRGDYAQMAAVLAAGFAPGLNTAFAGMGLSPALAGAATGASLGGVTGGIGGGVQGALKGAALGGLGGYAGGTLFGGGGAPASGQTPLNMAAIESGLGTPGYGFNAAAAQSGYFDPAMIGSGAYSQFGGNPEAMLQAGINPQNQLTPAARESLMNTPGYGYNEAAQLANPGGMVGGNELMGFDSIANPGAWDGSASLPPAGQQIEITGSRLPPPEGRFGGMPPMPLSLNAIPPGAMPGMLPPDYLSSNLPQGLPPVPPMPFPNASPPDYSNEGRNYPTPESTQGPGGSPVNSSMPSGSFLDMLKGGVASLGGLETILPIVGAIEGSRGQPGQTSTEQSRTDPRLDPFLYGDGGLLNAQRQWFDQHRSGTNATIQEGQNMRLGLLRGAMPGLQGLQQSAMGLLGGRVAGNPFMRG